MKKLLTILGILLLQSGIGYSITKRVLFLGNSYTYVNDLPQMIANVAASAGDTLVFSSHTIGGYSIGNHSIDSSSRAMIMQGGWDRVVLQGQSQELLTTTPEVSPFPYAHTLDSLVHRFNPCGETMFYMTWGYREDILTNDCVNFPLYCSYQVMDSVIHNNYMLMGNINRAEVSPVGAVRHYIRDQYPAIELYQADGSHPTVAGTYAGACTFYAAIFRKDPAPATFNPGIPVADANNIKNSASLVAYDSLSKWNIGSFDAYIDSLCGPTGIGNISHTTLATLSPNPATNTISIRTGNTAKQRAAIYNYMGTLCKEVELQGNTDVDISALPAGAYFIRFKDGTQVLKFVKY